MSWATLNGYLIVGKTDKAVAIRKVGNHNADWIWLPRGWCQDGDSLDVGDTDLVVYENRADEKDLDWS
jgi:hypothetical protein